MRAETEMDVVDPSPNSSSLSLTSTSTSSPSTALSPSPRDYTLLRCLGSGDLSTVYLCHPTHDHTLLLAMKVVDLRQAMSKNKNHRPQTELSVLRSLRHPFLPSLHAAFLAPPHHSCILIDFCPGGDLHSLRHRQPLRRFSPRAARFYATEVLAALQYLHLVGVVYRDLKPENILIRSDGHIMLSDFDLALVSTTSPELDYHDDLPRKSCLPSFLSRRGPSRRRVVAEPLAARSCSFVGTHEYVAPEVASGKEHGAAVDWWALGVFLYELIYGRTPFFGPNNETTLRNIVNKPLVFPDSVASGGGEARLEAAARDLIRRLLEKDPSRRLGSIGGAADVKAHRFFSGVNFALLRSVKPPVVPSGGRSRRKEKGFEFF